MSHILKAVPKRHALFLPEVLVDPLSSEPKRSSHAIEMSNIAADLEVTDQFIQQQEEELKRANAAKTTRDDEAALNAIQIAEESLDITKQQLEYERIQSERKQFSGRSNNIQTEGIQNGTKRGVDGHCLGRASNVDNRTSGFNSDNVGLEDKRKHHVYDEIHTTPPQRHFSQPEPSSEHASPFPDSRHLDTDQAKQNYLAQDSQHRQLHQNHHRGAHTSQFEDTAQDTLIASTGLQDDSNSSLSVGSLIQIPSKLQTDPWKFGTIKWIGTIANVQGIIAGIELVRIVHLISSFACTPLLVGTCMCIN